MRAVFCECFAVFPQNTQNARKHRKTLENHKKLTIRSCIAGVFQKPKIATVLHKTAFTFHKTSAKHRKTPQNTRKTVTKRVLRNYIAKHCKTHAKRLKTLQNAHNTAVIHIARILCFLPKYVVRSVAKAHDTQYTRKLRRGVMMYTQQPGGHVAGLHFFFKNSVMRFAVFCGVLLWCFAVFCVRVFSVFFIKQHKTDQKIYKTHKTNKIRFVQYSAIRCCASFSLTQKMSTKKFAKHVQKCRKTPAKHRKTMFFKKHSQHTAKYPQNTRKTPQNTTKHIC